MDLFSKQNVMDSTSNNNVNIMDSPEKHNVNIERTWQKLKCLIPHGLHRPLQLQ